MTAAAIRIWLTTWLSNAQRLPAIEIDATKRLSGYGLDSTQVVRLMADLSRALGRTVSPTLFFRYPTIAGLTAALVGEQPAPDALPQTGAAAPDDPIAIVGISCRFPGAAGPAAFWRSLCAGVDAIREIPDDRWNADALYDPDPAVPGKSVARAGGFLDRIDGFDSLFFGISPREAQEMDPQQRMMLELTWEALEDAGAPPTSLRGSRTGVFVGVIWQDYGLRRAADLTAITQHSATGRAGNIIANRVSYALGFHGPCLVVDTACSASLVAVHLACQSIRSGESTLAVAGGVNLMLAPDTMVALSKFGGLSPDGRSRAFDAGANGFARGEGGGVVVLKPLARALADGDAIYCVVRGSAVNNNGESSGLTAPSPWAQEAVLRDAWARANREPRHADYVEAHGTGTALGDPIEASALGAVMSADRPPGRPLRIGSVKTNIGHLEGAAGIAGLIKVALAIRHRALPPSLHFQTPNPDIAFGDLRLQVQTALEPWPGDNELALAGVSSFGWGGTNAHVVLEEARRYPAQLLPLSADSTAALHARATELAASLATQSPAADFAARCAGAGRLVDGQQRAAISARSSSELVARLQAVAAGQSHPGISTGSVRRRRRVAFVCTPQGSAWWGMGRELLADEPVFRAEIEALDRALRRLSGLSILDELTAPQAGSRLADVTVVQPLLFAVQSALVALLRSWGVEPDIIVGHSLGELVAAYVSGAIDRDDAATLIHHHSRLYGRTAGKAGMAVIGMAAAPLADLLAGYDGRVALAAYNSPVASVVSGDPVALDDFVIDATSRGISCQRIDVTIGGHYRALDPVLDEYRHELRHLAPRRSAIPMMSTVTVARLDGCELDAGYWVRNMREPVRFSQTIDLLLAEGYDAFIEISPTPVLTHSIQQIIGLRGSDAIALGTMRRGDERTALLDTVGALYVGGATVQWDRLAGPTLLDSPRETRAQLLPLSARSAEALRDLTGAVAQLPVEHPDVALSDLCYAAGVRRSHHEHRLAVVADSMAALIDRGHAFIAGAGGPGWSAGRVRPGQRRIVFVLAGQGSQWAGMGHELLAAEPVFQQSIERSDAAVMRHAGWSVLTELARSGDDSRLERTEIAQPALFAIEIALVELWASWGVVPDAVIGHSVGEVAAAYLAGALTFDAAVQIVCHRGQVMSAAFGHGRMASVALAEHDAQPLLDAFAGRLDLAAVNSPRSIVLSGEPLALEAAVEELSRRGVASHFLAVEYAFHGRQMDRAAADLAAAIETIPAAAASLPIFSTTTIGDAGGTLRFDAAHWARNLRLPVRFASAIERALEQGYDTFVEIGPHPVLARSLAECLERQGGDGLCLSSLRRGTGERQAMLESLGALYTAGFDVDFRRLHATPGRHVPLPTYPWHHRIFALEPLPLHASANTRSSPIEHDDPIAGRIAGDEDSSPDDLFLTMSWERAELPHQPVRPPSSRDTWLILSDVTGVGQALATQLEAAGERCELLFTPTPAQAIAAAGDGQPHRLRGVVYLRALDDLPAGAVTLQTLEQSQQHGVCGAIAVVQALSRLGLAEPPGLWLVTRNCHAANRGATATAVAQSPMWGLGQVALYEHPELQCRMLDLSHPTPTHEARAIAGELLAGDGEDAVRLTEDGRFVGRLRRYHLDARQRQSPAAGSVSAEATYLITGGLGALGLAVAAWLVDAGARHLLLLGRTPPSSGAEPVLAELRTTGAAVTVLQADVRDRAQMVGAFASIDQRWPLRGVIHAAGALDDGVIMQLTPERMLAPMGPKVDGAWNLHELTSTRPLDFFVLFSSAISLVGAPGQANYAAANAFLDALARHRRDRGLPALSVQWGPWADAGMAARHAGRGERLAAQGMASISARRALRALGALLAAGSGCPAQIGVLRFDATRWCDAHVISSPMFSHLRHRARAGLESAPSVRARLAEHTDGPARRELLELHLRDQAARVLRLEPAQIDLRGSLQRLGLDSLMTLELRRRLETSLGLRLPVTVIWDYPTIAALSPFLLERMGLALETPQRAANVSATSGPEAAQLVSLLQALGQLSGDALARLTAGGAGGADAT